MIEAVRAGLAWLAARPRVAAFAGAMCIAFSGIFFRFSGVSPSTATVFRCLYALPFLALLAAGEGRALGPRMIGSGMHQGGVLRVRVGRPTRGETTRLASVLPWLVVERARRVSQSTQRHAMTSARCASRLQGSLSRVPRRGWTVRDARSWQGLLDARTLSTERERHPADRHASGAIRSVAQSVSWHHARAGRRQERFLPAPKICKGLGLVVPMNFTSIVCTEKRLTSTVTVPHATARMRGTLSLAHSCCKRMSRTRGACITLPRASNTA